MKNLFALLIILYGLPVSAKHLYTESVYQDYWCTKHKGIQEYKLPDDSRVDCMLPNMAIEFDFAKKRDECLGQALRYSAYTGKPAGCCLIIENKKDLKYYRQLRYTIKKRKLNVKLYTISKRKIQKIKKTM